MSRRPVSIARERIRKSASVRRCSSCSTGIVRAIARALSRRSSFRWCSTRAACAFVRSQLRSICGSRPVAHAASPDSTAATARAARMPERSDWRADHRPAASALSRAPMSRQASAIAFSTWLFTWSASVSVKSAEASRPVRSVSPSVAMRTMMSVSRPALSASRVTSSASWCSPASARSAQPGPQPSIGRMARPSPSPP